MSGLLRGRVIDVFTAGAVRSAVVLAGAASHAVALAPDAPDLAPGDLVTLALAPGGARLHALHGRAAPGAYRADGDALRWRRPAESPSRMDTLWSRQAILRAI